MGDRGKIVDICRRLYDRGHIVSKCGNVSCRTNDGELLITPSRFKKSFLKADEMCVIDLDGNFLGGNGNISSEYRVHCAAYRKRPDVNAVVHAHSPYSVACSLATISFEYPLLPETALSLGSIPTIPYAAPGSEELALAVAPYFTDHNAVILERHGVVALGNDLEEAFDRLEDVEHAAKIAYFVSVKGRIPVMGRAQLLSMVNFAKKQGFPVPEVAMRLLHRILAK